MRPGKHFHVSALLRYIPAVEVAAMMEGAEAWLPRVQREIREGAMRGSKGAGYSPATAASLYQSCLLRIRFKIPDRTAMNGPSSSSLDPASG
jgi:hypothetical protein